MKIISGKLVILTLSIITLFIFLSMYVSYNNTEIDLRVNIEKKIKSNEAYFDKVWKIIEQKAGVASKYKEDFKNVYSSIMNERYNGKDNILFNWIQESNPKFDITLYESLSNSIEAERSGFLMQQQELLSMSGEHDKLLTKIPSSLFLFNRSKIDVPIITSAKTEEVFKSRKEDNVTLFQ